MANLGTLDRMGYGNGFGSDTTDTFNKYMAKQIVTNGSDMDKLLYLLGGAVGNAMRVNREGRENKKLDKIVSDAKGDNVVYVGDGSNIGINGMTPEQQKSYNQQIAEIAAMGNAPQNGNAISVGFQPNSAQSAEVDNALKRIALSPNQGGDFVLKPSGNGMNNYNWDYVTQQAREQGISDRILNSRKAEIQGDISKQADAVFLPSIQKDLYGYTDENGNKVAPTTDSRLRAMEKIEELKKYSPDTAKAYQSLALNGMQSEANFEQKKALTQMAADIAAEKDKRNLENRIAYKQATAGYGNNGVRTGKDIAFFDKEIDSALKQMASIENQVQQEAATAKEEGRTYSIAGTALDERYTALKNRVASLKEQREQLAGGGVQYSNTKNTGREGAATKQQSANPIDKFFNNVDYDDYNQMLSDGVTPDSDGKVHPKGAFYQLRDYLQSAKKNDGSSYTPKEINTILMDLAKTLPNWGEGSDYYETLASNLGVETEASKKQAEIDKRAAEIKHQAELAEILHPKDPMKGVRDTGSAFAEGKPIWNIASLVR